MFDPRPVLVLVPTGVSSWKTPLVEMTLLVTAVLTDIPTTTKLPDVVAAPNVSVKLVGAVVVPVSPVIDWTRAIAMLGWCYLQAKTYLCSGSDGSNIKSKNVESRYRCRSKVSYIRAMNSRSAGKLYPTGADGV